MFEMMSVGLRPRTSAAMTARIVRAPVPMSWVAALSSTEPSGLIVQLTFLSLGTAAAPLVKRHAQAVANGAAAVLAAGLPLLAPADQLGCLLDLTLVDRCAEVAVRQVLEPELQGIDAQLVGQVVHGRFHHGAALGMAGCPHGTGAAAIDEDLIMGSRGGGNIINIRKGEIRAAAGTAGAVGLRNHGDELAVLGRPQLDLARGAGAVAGRQVLLDTVQEQFHGLACRLGEFCCGSPPDVGPELGAESAAHVVSQDGDVRHRDVEGVGKLASDNLHRLGARPDSQLVRAFPPGGQPMRLEADMSDDRQAVGSLDHHVGLAHGLLGFPLGLGTAFPDVPTLEDLGRPFGHGLMLGDHMWQHLVLDLDGADRVARLLLGLGGHRGDVVALVAKGRSGSGDGRDRLDTGHLLGGGRIDRLDLGVGMRAIQHHREQGSLGTGVAGILGAARCLGQAIEPGDLGADQAGILGPGEGHGFRLLSSLWPRRGPPGGRQYTFRTGRCCRRAPS